MGVGFFYMPRIAEKLIMHENYGREGSDDLLADTGG
jgi:hypothetical protein